MSSRTLFVGRLSFDARTRDLEDFFHRYRPYSIEIKRGGFAFVEFYHKEDAADAIHDLDGRDLRGRRVSIEWARGGKKNKDSDVCFRCGREGHWARHCPNSSSSSSRSGKRGRSRSGSRSRSRSRSRSPRKSHRSRRGGSKSPRNHSRSPSGSRSPSRGRSPSKSPNHERHRSKSPSPRHSPPKEDQPKAEQVPTEAAPAEGTATNGNPASETPVEASA